MSFFRNWLKSLAERKVHNDRDYKCRYWWGDRGGYDLCAQRCLVCNPAQPSDTT